MGSAKNKPKIYVSKHDDHDFSCKVAKNIHDEPIKAQDGFSSHFEAQQWGENVVGRLLYPYRYLSFKELAAIADTHTNVKAWQILTGKIDDLAMQLFFVKTAKEGIDAEEAEQEIDVLIGETTEQRFAKAADGTLDALSEVDRERSIERAQAMLRTGMRMMHQPSPQALEVLALLNRIPGDKIATFSVGGHHDGEVFDIKSDGKVGYDPSHINLFYEVVDRGLKDTGSIIVRQFIEGSATLMKVASGEMIPIPWKAIYGIILHEGMFYGLPAEDVEYGHTHDIHDKPLAKLEERLMFKDIAEFMTPEADATVSLAQLSKKPRSGARRRPH